jgi:hypothetical protein
MNVLLDIESDERNPVQYPDPNDYVIKLNRDVFNVTNISLKAAQIPLSQTLINDYNNTFSVNSSSISLPNQNFSTGDDLAGVLQTELGGGNSNIDSVVYNSNTEALTFSNIAGGSSNIFTFEFYDGVNGYAIENDKGTPADILGFNRVNQSNIISSNVLTGEVINLHGPTSIVIRLTTNSTDLSRSIYNVGTSNVGALDYTESVYFGRLLSEFDIEKEFLIYTGEYPIEEMFHKGPEKSISELRIRFYYTIGSKLVPYDFGKRNHTLKFKFTCSLDKLSTLEKQIVYEKVLPPPVNIPVIDLPKKHNKQQQIILIFIVLLCGLFVLLMLKQ